MLTSPTLRRLVIITLFAAAPLAFLAAQAPEQKPPAGKAEPPRKPSKEEEEDAAVRLKRTRPLRVEDEGAPLKPGGAVTTPAVDLAAEAERARNPIVRQLYRDLAVPHDRIRFVSPAREEIIEPLARFVVRKPSGAAGAVTYRPLNERSGKEFTLTLTKDHGITYYEQHAVDLVEAFLQQKLEQEPPSSRKHLSRANMLREAERVLASVVRFHESARERGVRQKEGWETLENTLRTALRKVQIRHLNFLADTRDWERAVALGAHLAKTYPDGSEAAEVRKEFTQVFVRQAEEALKANDYRAARFHLERLLEHFPNSAAAEPVRARLQKRAGDLLGEAEQQMEKDKKKAAEFLKEAEAIWPHLTQLTTYRLRFGSALSTLNVGVRSVPEFLSPATAHTDVEKQALDLLFEGLVKYRAHAPGGPRYEPVLAADMPRLTPLGREFQLQRQAYWSNGERVTAPDVSHTIGLLQGRRSGQVPSWVELLDRQNAVSVGGDAFQLRLTLSQGYLDPLSLMTFKVLPQLKELKGADDRDFAKKPVGSGPFVLQSLTTKEAVFGANSYYGARPGKGGQPRVHEVRLYQSEDPEGDFLNGRLHLLLDPPTKLYQDLQDARKGLKGQTLRNRRVWFLAVNHRKSALQDVKLRRALGLAINREQILKECFRAGLDDVHRPLNGPYPPDSWAHNPDVKPADPHNRTFAAALAQEALTGRPDGMKLKLSYPAGDAAVHNACVLIKKQVQELQANLDLDLVPSPPAKLREDVEVGHQYDLAYYCWDYPDHTFWLWPLFDPAGGRDFLGYQNEVELGSPFRRLLSHRDFQQVQKHTHQIHKHIHDQMPLIPLWQLDTHLVSHPRLELPANLDAQAVFSDVDAWKLEPR